METARIIEWAHHGARRRQRASSRATRLSASGVRVAEAGIAGPWTRSDDAPGYTAAAPDALPERPVWPAASTAYLVVSARRPESAELAADLAALGLGCEIAHSGAAAAWRLGGDPGRRMVVLVDRDLDDMPGPELARRLRREPSLGQLEIVGMHASACAAPSDPWLWAGAHRTLTLPLKACDVAALTAA